MTPAGKITAIRCAGLALAAILAAAALPAAGAVLTGEVQAVGAQPIRAPQSTNSIVTLQFFVPAGTRVKKGQPVLRINAGAASGQVQKLQDQIALTRATSAKKLAALKLTRIDARLALVKAKAARDKARLDAGIPKKLISALKYDKYHGTYKSARRQVKLKKKALAAAGAAVERQRHDGKLKTRKLELELKFYQAKVDASTVLASQAGVVTHGFRHFGMNGSPPGRFREGSIAFSGGKVGEVVSTGEQHFSVRAWALQPNRRGLETGQAVRVHFDALPAADVAGRITAISAASQSRPEWGDGHYYRIEIALGPAAERLELLPGMSARVQTKVKLDHRPPASIPAPRRALHVTGQVFARQSWWAVPPRIRGFWRLKVARMAPDGTHVKKGQPIVRFAAGRLAQKLPAAKSKLVEQKRARKRLRLKLANAKRSAKLAVAKAKGEAIKARRKAKQPKKYVAAIKYQKLVISRKSTRKILALTKKRARVSGASRKAQMAVADAKVAQAKSKVRRMQKEMASLVIRAPRDGLFLHRIKNNGTRVSAGDRVFFGTRVGSMPDMSSLAVHAALPERDLRRVHVGQPVQVVLSGGASRTLDGHIARIGKSVHSKSNAKPIPVVKLLVTFAKATPQLKPGRSVSVVIPPAHAEAS